MYSGLGNGIPYAFLFSFSPFVTTGRNIKRENCASLAETPPLAVDLSALAAGVALAVVGLPLGPAHEIHIGGDGAVAGGGGSELGRVGLKNIQ